MKLLKQLKFKAHFEVLSNNGKFVAFVKSMNVVIYDLENDCLLETLNIKHCGQGVFLMTNC